MQKEFVKKLLDANISLGEYYYLLTGDINYLLFEEPYDNLIDNGYIDGNHITTKASDLINDLSLYFKKTKKKFVWTEEELELLREYNNIFPKMMLPSGKPARCTEKDLKERFVKFFESYDYSWDTIIKATKKYLEMRESDGWKYCKTSGYLVMKGNESELADLCAMIEDNKEDYNNNYFKTAVV